MIQVVNAKRWASLSPADQQILREESKKAGDLMRKLLADAETQQIEDLQKRGMLIVTPNPAAFRAKMDPAYKKISEYAGTENVQRFLVLVDQAKKK
jgi:TRAP-type C4-dicarboxylate transport system substrate-binding protein